MANKVKVNNKDVKLIQQFNLLFLQLNLKIAATLLFFAAALLFVAALFYLAALFYFSRNFLLPLKQQRKYKAAKKKNRG